MTSPHSASDYVLLSVARWRGFAVYLFVSLFFVFLLFGRSQSQCWMGPNKEEGKAKLCVDSCIVLMFCCEHGHVGKRRVSPINIPQWGCSSMDLVKVLQALPRTNRTETQNTEDSTMPTPEATNLLGKHKGGKERGFWVKETRGRPEKEGPLRCLWASGLKSSQWEKKYFTPSSSRCGCCCFVMSGSCTFLHVLWL